MSETKDKERVVPRFVLPRNFEFDEVVERVEKALSSKLKERFSPELRDLEDLTQWIISRVRSLVNSRNGNIRRTANTVSDNETFEKRMMGLCPRAEEAIDAPDAGADHEDGGD